MYHRSINIYRDDDYMHLFNVLCNRSKKILMELDKKVAGDGRDAQVQHRKCQEIIDTFKYNRNMQIIAA